MRAMSAIFTKQMNDTFKNPTVTMIFILLPVVAFLMVNFIEVAPDLPAFAGIAAFASMGIALMPLGSMPSYISEDIETNSLRFLVMAGVKPMQYLFGLSAFTLLLASLSMLAFGLIGGLSGGNLLLFLGASIFALLPAIALGALLGIVSKNVQQGMTFGTIFGLVLGMTPMFAMASESIMNVTKFLFSQQVTNIYMYIVHGPPTYMDWSLTQAFIIVGVNFLVFAVLFFAVYKKKGVSLG